ncbi:CpaF family protein [Candidatus Uhrbacteria bacterium]|nr:CpaF family protein [Candidatus Uhrbacteria bacterium]
MSTSPQAPTSATTTTPTTITIAPHDLKTSCRAVHQQLVAYWEKHRLSPATLASQEVGGQIFNISKNLFRDLSAQDHQQISQILIDKLFGLGPLEPLLKRTDITEIMINGCQSAYIEVNGQLSPADIQFEDEKEILTIINKMVSRIGRRIDESTPYVDARLPDGSRVNAIIRPLAITGPVLTIRKFPSQPLTLADLVQRASLTQIMADYLSTAVKNKQNIVIAGGTGSGKTSLLNALASQIPVTERIITIEDAAEIRLSHPHVISLEARLPNIEGTGEITVRTLLKNSLRMRPDRIIIGETRGGEALDMLQAMNTGHQGSLTTVHANSPAEALLRLETMALMAELSLPPETIKSQIRNAVNLIVQQERLSDGTRKIISISQINKSSPGHQLEVQPLFTFDKPTGQFI